MERQKGKEETDSEFIGGVYWVGGGHGWRIECGLQLGRREVKAGSWLGTCLGVKPRRKGDSEMAPLRSGNPGRLGALKLEKYLFYHNLPIECINYLG